MLVPETPAKQTTECAGTDEPQAKSSDRYTDSNCGKRSSMYEKNSTNTTEGSVPEPGVSIAYSTNDVLGVDHPAVEQSLSHGSATTISSYADVFFPVQRNPVSETTTAPTDSKISSIANTDLYEKDVDSKNMGAVEKNTHTNISSVKKSRSSLSQGSSFSKPGQQPQQYQQLQHHSFKTLLETSRSISQPQAHSVHTPPFTYTNPPVHAPSLKLGSPAHTANNKNGPVSAPIISELTNSAVSRISSEKHNTKGSIHTGVKRMASSRSLSKMFSTSSLTVLHENAARTANIYEEARPGSHTPPSPRRGSLTVMSPLMLTRKNSLEVHGSPSTLQRRNSLEVPLDRRMSVEFRPTDMDKRVERTSLCGDDLFASMGDDHSHIRRTSSPSLVLDHNLASTSAPTLPPVSNSNIMSMDLKTVGAIRDRRSSLSMSSRDSLTSVGSASSLAYTEHTSASPREPRLPAASYKRTHSDSESSVTGHVHKKRHLSTNGAGAHLAGLANTSTRPEKLIVTYNDEESGATVTKDVEEDVEDIVLPCPKRSSSIVSEHGERPLRKFSIGPSPTRVHTDSMSTILSKDDDSEKKESGGNKKSTVTML
ncbi:hypothetical protein SARC_04644 [Sphaeroforma arctica JP610]|uniref:Uncharacterized protein n=1 Tax=Sphaeroforma arctica JP610 TaxID=667725 RepID=A0A0L0G1Z1_9EUKA|nr:hypothetical protein SARC_04644 [Sphaeroforma arctica JP610]KNC83085.1 hypothetical protein SARC_04644 [Sphaeroforma arctica JP610]|eukprot:XP_014156987.1 hypothetical protein SARC_04644 [Sphaeroforma arctica JP610]